MGSLRVAAIILVQCKLALLHILLQTVQLLLKQQSLLHHLRPSRLVLLTNLLLEMINVLILY